MSATVVIDGDVFRVELSGFSGKLSMNSQVEVPMADVVSARATSVDDAREGQPLKELFPVVGTWFPGLFKLGSFGTGDQKQFWYVHDHDRVLVIDLDHDEYTRLVLEVDDPDQVAARINARRAHAEQ
jgi:hypothetical protein